MTRATHLPNNNIVVVEEENSNSKQQVEVPTPVYIGGLATNCTPYQILFMISQYSYVNSISIEDCIIQLPNGEILIEKIAVAFIVSAMYAHHTVQMFNGHLHKGRYLRYVYLTSFALC